MNDMRVGLSSPALVVDTAALDELAVLSIGVGPVFGAATTMSELDTAEAGRRYPALVDAAALLGGRQMQAVATARR